MSRADRCGVYMILNKINAKKYIGSARNMPKRWHYHRERLRANDHTNRHLQRAWNKYGEDAFVFSVLEVCEIDLLLVREQSYLPTEKTAVALKSQGYYNENPVAGSPAGRIVSEETRKKMAENMRKRWTDPAYREDFLKRNVGKKKTEEWKKQQSLRMQGNKIGKLLVVTDEMREARRVRALGNQNTKGHRHTDATKQAISKKQTGKKYSSETREKISKAVKAGKKRKRNETTGRYE